jgi:hypothetical protein
MEKKAADGQKKIVVQALIDKIKNENKPNKIRTHVVEGYKKPERITNKDGDQQQGYFPDVIAESNGRKDLFEVELDDKDYVLEKWRLFSLYSKKNKGDFSIITPKDKLEQVRNMVKSNQIDARLIYFS